MIDLRAATPSDAEMLARIHAASFDRPWIASDFAEWLARDAAAVWVVQQHGDLRAFGLATVISDEAELYTIATVPEARRSGLGSEVFYALDREAEQRGASEWRLEVARKNAAARAFYNRLGFFEIGLRKGYYPGGDDPDDALVMARKVGRSV